MNVIICRNVTINDANKRVSTLYDNVRNCENIFPQFFIILVNACNERSGMTHLFKEIHCTFRIII